MSAIDIKHIYVNVEDNRVLDTSKNASNKNETKVIGDVQRVGLPNIEHPTTTINSSGMIADVDMPNTNHFNAMELTIEHNKGDNYNTLTRPGKHVIEFRVARQVYDIAKGEIGHQGVKYRMTCVHKATENSQVENNNPLGVTDRFSILRYESITDGKTDMLIDAMTGTIQIDGKTYSDDVKKLLQ